MSIKFCPECGTAVEPGAGFCGSCGQPVGKSSGGSNPLPLAGIITLVALLALGGGFWLYFRLAPEQARPLKPGERAPGVMANAPAGAPGGVPGQNHPPLELPDDIKTYMADLQREADKTPDDKEKWTTLAGVYYRASRLDKSYTAKANDAFEHLISVDEKDLDGLRGLGNLAYDRQDRESAIKYYERYLAASPADSEVRTDLGTIYYQSEQPDRAIAEYERVIATSPMFYQAHFNLAVVYDANGDRAASHAALENARDRSTDDAVKQRIGDLLEIAQDQNLSLTDAAAALGSQAGAGGTAPGAAPGTAPPQGQAAAAPADTFEDAVEQLFRGHRIAGPKVVDIEWPDATTVRVLMANFPMDQMPEVMKIGYMGKMSDGVKAAQERFDVEGPVKVELVDKPTGKVMATVDPTSAEP